MKNQVFELFEFGKMHGRELLLLLTSVLVVLTMSFVLHFFSTSPAEVSCFVAAFLSVFGMALFIQQKSHRRMNSSYAFAYVMSLFLVGFSVIIWAFIIGAKNPAVILLGVFGAWGTLAGIGLNRMEQQL